MEISLSVILNSVYPKLQNKVDNNPFSVIFLFQLKFRFVLNCHFSRLSGFGVTLYVKCSACRLDAGAGLSQ